MPKMVFKTFLDFTKIRLFLHHVFYYVLFPLCPFPLCFLFINPWHVYTARVTVVGLSVCLCVCLSVKSYLTSRMSNRAINELASYPGRLGGEKRPGYEAINERVYSVACEHQKICGDLPKTTAFKRYAVKHEPKS